jgi:antibiotic biosynthesis monooxygenase (ABM) superfamily enzyme
MALVTLLGVFPTSLLLTVTVGAAVHAWPLPARSLVIAGCMVALLTWLVMPLLTRLLHCWLHKERT